MRHGGVIRNRIHVLKWVRLRDWIRYGVVSRVVRRSVLEVVVRAWIRCRCTAAPSAVAPASSAHPAEFGLDILAICLDEACRKLRAREQR